MGIRLEYKSKKYAFISRKTTRMVSTKYAESVMWYRDDEVVKVIKSEFAKEREGQG